MARAYRKKPVVVEAVQWTGNNHADMCEFIDPEVFEIIPRVGLVIHTLEGDHHASPGDYIIKGVNGEFYPCKPDIFAKTYEADLPTLTQPNEWVSVEERLPTDARPVLTFVGYADTMTGFITTSSYFCFDANPHWQWDGLTQDEQKTLFWMPLPEPPGKETSMRLIDADELLVFPYSESAGTDEQIEDWIEECGLSDEEVIDRAKKLCWMVIEGFVNVIKTAPTLTPPNETPPCYQPDGDGCAYQCYDGDDEPIDKCKECPLCYSDKQRHLTPPNEPLTQADLDSMDYDKVWLDYGADGEWALVVSGRIYSLAVLEGAGFEDILRDEVDGETMDRPSGDYAVYRRPLEGEV